jgi:two-component system, cell cycle response regulator
MSAGKTLSVLVVEDNPAYARLVKETLKDSTLDEVSVEVAPLLVEALDRLGRGGVDVVLLDLGLPDAHGSEGFLRISEDHPEVPVVVLTGFDDEEMAMEVVRQGAQDYLVKGRSENDSLGRALRYAVERHRMQAQLRQLAIIDELTGLHNRRGFATLAEQQLKLARRRGTPAAVLFVDLDGMKGINDTYGHGEGDQALTDTADLLRATFRTSDLLARVGGDEFCVFLPDCDPPTATVVTERLREAVRAHNESAGRPYALSLSVGVAEFDPAKHAAIDDLIEHADRSMYREKSARAGTS